MPSTRVVGFLFVALLGSAGLGPVWAQSPASIRGKVTANGSPLEGAYVGAHAAGKTFTKYVMTSRTGEFTFRGLAPGDYGVFTRIPGFRALPKNGVTVQAGREATADFQVERETDFLALVEQASNAELLESFPLTEAQKKAIDYRCSDCHGEYYLAKSRFPLRDWQMIVNMMDDVRRITPAGDISKPPDSPNANTHRRPPPSEPDHRPARQRAAFPPVEGSENQDIARYLAQIRGPDSPDFPIQFMPRATGDRTRAVITEYDIPRVGATIRSVRVDPRGRYVWYPDWRANLIGRIEIETGEVKEYPIPVRDDPSPPGMPNFMPGMGNVATWDPLGKGILWIGQMWSGRSVRFDTWNEKITGIWAPPEERSAGSAPRGGGITACLRPDGSVTYRMSDWIVDLDTGRFTVMDRSAPRMQCQENPLEENLWDGAWSPGGGPRSVSYKDPQTGMTKEFPVTSVSRWARPYNAVGDPARQVGWTAPDVIDHVIKVDAGTGRLTAWPLPSHGQEIRNIDIERSANPPAIWFINQRLGSVIRFQEYTE